MTKGVLWPALLFSLIALCSATAHEKPSYPVDGADADMTVRIPVAERPPTIDGRLEESEWAGAATVGHFLCLAPDHGTPATLRTTVYLMGGEGHLYVAFECETNGPGSLQMSETREDAGLTGQDRVSILLDTLHDHRRLIELTANPRGAKYDARWGNSEWDALWSIGGAVYEKSYVIEIDVDLGSLTYEKSGEQTIGVNFLRYSQVPDEDTGWAVDERSSTWDMNERKFPHLAGLVFPAKPAEQDVVVHAFAVAINDWEPDGQGFRTNAGLDIEYPLTTSVTSRYVLFPDFSDVEAAYESIDVSYSEQFLPEKREFFTRQREFFGGTDLFHSRRIGNFDYGAKVTGAYDSYRIGALDTYDPGSHRNDLVAHVTQELGRQADASVSLVDVREPGFYNTAFSGGFHTHFKENSPWQFELGHARSWGTQAERVGYRTNALLSYNKRLMGYTLQCNDVSPNFDPVDGFNPRRGFKVADLNAWRVWETQAGKRFYQSVELFGHHAQGVTSDGRFYTQTSRLGTCVRFNQQSRIHLIYDHDLHLEEQIRPEPFDDQTFTFRGEVGANTNLCWRGSYKLGTVEDSRLHQYGLSVQWRSDSGSMEAWADYSRRLQDFFDGSRERAQTFNLSLTRVLDPEHWVSLRWYTRRGDTNISNLSLVYRLHTQEGKEFFLILGDPQADQIHRKVAVKYVHPFTF